MNIIILLNGAIQESNHVFIENGLKEILKSKGNIRIFEMGFGTGLNAFLTMIYSLDQDADIQYTTIDAYPVEEDILKRLNYGKIFNEGTFENYFSDIHSFLWGKWNKVNDRFLLKKNHVSLLDFHLEEKYDLVYFDAFAPNVQPELWATGIFENMFNLMNSGGILVTYCCKGDVKRVLKSAGFSIEKLRGPPGKREMLRARKV